MVPLNTSGNPSQVTLVKEVLTEGLHGWDASLQEGQPERALLQLHIKGLVEGEHYQVHTGGVADEVIVNREVCLMA